jgi:Spy/CpxP family protein refolding chaperone
MVCIHQANRPLRYHLPNYGWTVIFVVILVVSGCTHHGARERAQGKYAHGASSSPHMGLDSAAHYEYGKEMEGKLMLTNQQKETFNRIESEYKKMVAKKTSDIRMAEIELAELLAKEEDDREVIQEQVKTIGNLKEEMMMARIDSLLTLNALFTKDQYEQFQEILQQRMKQMVGNGMHAGGSHDGL